LNASRITVYDVTGGYFCAGDSGAGWDHRGTVAITVTIHTGVVGLMYGLLGVGSPMRFSARR
jgi:hypothetical protein